MDDELKELRDGMPPAIWEAHRHSSRHKEEIQRSAKCACFQCLAIFGPEEIEEWIDEPEHNNLKAGHTACCPRCGIDSVIGDASGVSLSDEFVKQMKYHWFDK